MDENYSVLLEANGELVEGHCKRRQSGILKASRSPLRTLKETDISQKLEPVGKFRRSSRRVSFAETKEIKEFVTDKIIQADEEDDEMISTLQCKQNMETYNTRDGDKDNLQEELGRDMMPQDTNCKIAGMDALLHAPLRTSLQSEVICGIAVNILKLSVNINSSPFLGLKCEEVKKQSHLRNQNLQQNFKKRLTSDVPWLKLILHGHKVLTRVMAKEKMFLICYLVLSDTIQFPNIKRQLILNHS
ncbi:kinetochore scaffold 1-like [Leucoraja erinacea]|uniref:kinetochore scaffold 1-like n=1 Tax=Leucoraja erinaceus TaxID=7782 RepID=UPI002454C917|nr:kinetochore scaffold 1-like [Leucoraja erinacea]